MGQKRVLTEKQQLIFNEIAGDSFLSSQFYFTGGTALSVFYLRHRESDDLDFFSETEFDPGVVLAKINKGAKRLRFEFVYTVIENNHTFQLGFQDKEQLKIDFAYYPHGRIEKGLLFEGVEIDSLSDMAANKLMTVIQRSEVKDFVDVYFLLEKYTIWDLLHFTGLKFGAKTDPFLIASDFMKAGEFEFMPKMIKPLTLVQLKEFFIKTARELSRKEVE